MGSIGTGINKVLDVNKLISLFTRRMPMHDIRMNIFTIDLLGWPVSWALALRNPNQKLGKVEVFFGPVQDHHQTLSPFVDHVELLNTDILPSRLD